MRKYKKLMILSGILVLIIALLTVAMVVDFDLLLFKNLSISGVENKKQDTEALIKDRDTENANYTKALEDLKKSENSYDVEKEAYENIPQSDITVVQQATIDEKYFIEYLWVDLGNYAKTNNLKLNIITPGSSYSSTQNENTNGEDVKDEIQTGAQSATNTTDNQAVLDNAINTTTGENDKIQIIVKGRYSDLADFVFDVETDSSLRFKLDNIKMIYSGDNKVEATFDVLSLSVLK